MAVFAFARAPACAVAIASADYARRRNLWICLTLVVFLANNFWIYIVVSGVLLFFVARREPRKFAMFFFFLLALPTMEGEIRGLGPIRNLFTIEAYRLIALTVLVPAFLSLRRQPDVERFGSSIPDRLLLAHMVLFFVLKMNTDASVTDVLRNAVFYSFIEIFLPYYVASRGLRSLPEFRDALMAFLVGALVVGAIGVFEISKGWLLYGGLDSAMGTKRSLIYAGREGSVRAVVTFGLSIPFGFVMAVAAGLFLYVQRVALGPTARLLGWAVLLAGLISGLSRGPWVGFGVMLLVFILAGPSAFANMIKLTAIGILALPLLALPWKEKILFDYLPFVGSVQEQNVTYRVRLIEGALKVMSQWPWFGTFDALNTPEMQALKQGQGIIDVVNTYLQIGLERGGVGLAIFTGFFAAVAVGIIKGMKSIADKKDERHLLGQGLLGTLVGILAIITTVSSVLIIPWIYWSIAGIGVAYARMIARTNAPAAH